MPTVRAGKGGNQEEDKEEEEEEGEGVAPLLKSRDPQMAAGDPPSTPLQFQPWRWRSEIEEKLLRGATY